MTKYEMLYILTPEIEEEAKKVIIKKFEDIVTDNGGNVEKTEEWGLKKLQYPVKFKSEGFFVLMTFEAKPDTIAELERIAGITDEVIRRLTTKK